VSNFFTQYQMLTHSLGQKHTAYTFNIMFILMATKLLKEKKKDNWVEK